MASTHQLVQAVNDMQLNAQSNLPVHPNNGNPAGAHNMPRQQAPVNPTYQHYPWMQPTVHLQNINARVQAMAANLGAAPQIPMPAAEPVQQPVAAPVMPVQGQLPPPVLPVYG